MNAKFGVLFVMTLMLGATTAEANYTIVGEFTGTADYFSGVKDFFRSSMALDVDRVVGSIELYATTAQPVPYVPGSNSYEIVYKGTANYTLSLFPADSQTPLLSYTGTGSDASFAVYNWTKDKMTTASYGITMATGGTLGGNYVPSSFTAFPSTNSDSFNLVFQNAVTGKFGTISGNFLSSNVSVTPAVSYTEPPLPTPLPGSLPLFGSGLVGFGFLWRRSRLT